MSYKVETEGGSNPYRFATKFEGQQYGDHLLLIEAAHTYQIVPTADPATHRWHNGLAYPIHPDPKPEELA